VTYEEIKRQFFASKEGILDSSDLIQSVCIVNEDFLRYVCPCGSSDHDAIRFYYPMQLGEMSAEPSDVLNCFDTRRQWLIRPPNVVGMIESEERKYFELLRHAPAIVKKVIDKRGKSDLAFDYLLDTHGIDRETAELYC